MRVESSGSLMDEATGATIVLTVACGRTGDGAVERDGLSIPRDCSDQNANHKDPVAQLQIRESALGLCPRARSPAQGISVGLFTP
jgi:hypothetical protein